MKDQTGRKVFVLKRIVVILIVLFLSLGVAPGPAQSSDDSYVIGRITGTFQELPGYFHRNINMMTRSIDAVEFTGFRLIRVQDGKKFLIRPDYDGFFYQKLPGGSYTLVRKRTDRPSYKEPKTIDIMSLQVESGTLVNLGTVQIILDGEPHESLRSSRSSVEGTYIYRYRYEKDPGDSGYDLPGTWFGKKKSRIVADFGDRIVLEGSAITSEEDGSKVFLRDTIPPWDR